LRIPKGRIYISDYITFSSFQLIEQIFIDNILAQKTLMKYQVSDVLEIQNKIERCIFVINDFVLQKYSFLPSMNHFLIFWFDLHLKEFQRKCKKK
jgi:hypothetical protein